MKISIGNLKDTETEVNGVLARLHLEAEADRQLTSAQQLSGGELKKISLGRALLREPNILIFDEPFEHLDAAGRQVVEEMLSDQSRTRIFVQHGENKVTSAEYIIQL